MPCDKLSQSVARTLEYAYNDWCIYTMGKALGRPEKEIKIYAKRAMNYRNVFDPSLNLMRGKDSNGKFETPRATHGTGPGACSTTHKASST